MNIEIIPVTAFQQNCSLTVLPQTPDNKLAFPPLTCKLPHNLKINHKINNK